MIAKETARARDAAFRSLCARVRGCTVCTSMDHVHVLSETNGSLDVGLLFVAEAPGRLGAARTGIPMTSDVAGRRFHAFLDDAGIARERVFVTNAILCNPLTADGRNRRPAAAEVAACREYLAGQIELVRAPIVVALGGVALDTLGKIEPHEAVLARDAGTAIAWNGRTLVPLYHPGIQSTLTRRHERQRADWRRLGKLARSPL